MTINRKTWLTFTILGLLGFIVWFKFTYPQFSFVDLSVTKTKASKISKDYLTNIYGQDIDKYTTATVFSGGRSADQYLQRSLGFKKELEFIGENDFELFFWITRFFKENEKEQFFVTVSAATGEVTGFSHGLKANDERPIIGESTSKQKVIEFLKTNFDFDPNQYILHSNLTKKFDHRTNYSFSWEKKGVFIRWKDDKEDSGGAKLLIGATIAGDEILSFYKNRLKIPDQFNRYVSRKKNVGRNLAIIIRIAFFIIITASVFFVIVRRNDIVMRNVKNFCIAITCSLFLLKLFCYFNEFKSIIYHYPTTSSMISYLWRYMSSLFFDLFLVTISILMPSLAGESLHYEVSSDQKEGSFLHYMISTFWSRNIFQLICFGYIIAIVMIGMQSALFEFGRNYLGVWVEYTWLSQFSASYFPFFTIFVIAVNASLSEELTFRLFSINLGKKFLKNTLLAVIISSLIWGFGHSTYPVFPMWFRGLEVTCLGLFFSYIYLRYGIIPVIVAHYLFDVFWGSSAYILGRSTPFLFYSCIFILLLPFLLGIIAYILNRSEKERDMTWKLTKHQLYNLDILKDYLINRRLLENKTEEELLQIKKDIMSHGWDIAVVEIAIKDLVRS